MYQETGIVWARAGTRSISVRGQDLIHGPWAAEDTLRALERADLIVGHGLLTADLRALAMVAPVPDALLDRCIDPLLVLQEARGGRWGTGLGLIELAAVTLGVRYHDVRRLGRFDPRDIAMLNLRLWHHLRTRRQITMLRGPGASVEPWRLGEDVLEQLAGRTVLGAKEWRRRRLERGTIVLADRPDEKAAELARLGDANQAGDLGDLHACVADLVDDYKNWMPDPWLLGVLQQLVPSQNLPARQALARGGFRNSQKRIGAYHAAFVEKFDSMRWESNNELSA